MQPNEATLNDAVVARALEFFENSPAYRNLYLAALEHCRERTTEADALAFVDGLKHSASQIRSAGSLVESLVSIGLLGQTILVDGEPYAGTLRELQFDDDIPEDASVEIFEQTTDLGIAMCERLDEVYSVATLAAAHPERLRAFLLVLEACSHPEGRSTSELEGVLREADALEIEERTGLPGVYPSYFTGELERVGALEWNGKKWVTTEKGSAALADGDLQDATA